MRDTDWRPSPCPKCGTMRHAAENPICTNPSCEVEQLVKMDITISQEAKGTAKDRIMQSIKRKITRFDQAAQEYAFKESYDPMLWSDIEDDYKKARLALETSIERLI